MWIAGLDALRKPLLHLHTQANEALPWADDRHGLHEPQPGRPRRPRVRLHPDPARRRRARPSPATSTDPEVRAPGRRVGPRRARARGDARRCGWPASATTCATSPSPRATRSRPSSASASRSTPTASTTWSPPSTRSPTPRSTRWSRSTTTRYDVAPELRPAATGTSRCATAPASRLGLRGFLDDGGFTAFTTNFEDLGGLRQLPGLAVQRLMADGYGFGGEGDWKTVGRCVRTLKAMAGRTCPAARRSWRTTPTTSAPGEEKILGAHMLEVCPSIAGGRAAARDPPAGHRRPRGPGAAGVRPPTPGPASSSASPTWATGSGWWPTRSTSSPPDEPLPKLPVARAVWRPRPDLRTSAESWLTAGGPHHTVLSTAVDVEELDDLAEMTGTELRRHRRRAPHPLAVRQRAALEPGLLPAGGGLLRRAPSAETQFRPSLGLR